MGFRILLVGGGGREHALTWKLASSPLCERLVVAPGNPGILGLSRAAAPWAKKISCVPVGAESVNALVALAERESLDFVVCGPEGALVAGLQDACVTKGILFFGPSQAAAEIEGSKAFAKELMVRAGVPTAAYGSFSDIASALAFIDRQPGNVVVKADGLCAGKGVVVASSRQEARDAVKHMLGDRAFGDAGARVVIEERLIGREVSMMALCDGTRFALLASAEDHKAVRDGDQGPNTGGMGAYSPSPLVDDALALTIGQTIFAPTIKAMADAGRPFSGLLYGGLILTSDRGPMVIEWNCRFGDPETQAVLVRMQDDLVPWLVGAARGRLPSETLHWKPGLGVCVVLAAEGYPGSARSGDPIVGLGDDGQTSSRDVIVFHAGTKHDSGQFITSGGRVLSVTGTGPTLDTARAAVYETIGQIRWPGMHFRNDIGRRRKQL